MTQTNNNTAPTPSISQNNSNKQPKPVGKWRYRIIIAFLILIIIALLGGAGYGGWYLWRQNEDKVAEVNKLQDEVETLREERNLSSEDLRKEIDTQKQSITDLSAENKRLSEELTSAKSRIDQLTPKDIKDLNYKQLIKVNETTGDVWLNPIYADVNGDGRLDGIYAYRTSGTGGFLYVHIYSYLEGNTLSEILKVGEYQKGQVTYIPETNVVEIKSQAGTPDAPTVATTNFKWDAASKKMMRI